MPGKYRYELKYQISPVDAALLKKQLALVCKKDPHSISDEVSYYIRSLYFDDPAGTAFYDKVNGEFKRKKYRIRIYNGTDDVIKLECKHKDGNFTYKEEETIDRKTCELILDKKYSEVAKRAEQATSAAQAKPGKEAEASEGQATNPSGTLERFLLDAKLFGLKPAVIVDYQRLAFTYPISDVRITFDENIRSGKYNYELFTSDINTIRSMQPGPVEIEIKFNENMPDHIAAILNSVPKLRQAISKFALSCIMK